MTARFEWIETRLHRPGTQILLGCGALFAAIGCGLIAFWRHELGEVPAGVDLFDPDNFRDYAYVWVIAILGFGFAGMGTLVVVLGLRNTFAPGTVRHVPDEAVPEVPTNPLLPVDATTFGVATHRLTGNRLEPDRSVLAGKRKFIFAFAIVFGAFVLWLLTTLRPIGESLLPNLLFGLFGVAALAAAVLIIDYLIRHLAKRLVTFDFSGQAWTIRDNDDVVASGRREDLVAVQIVAARHRIRTGRRTTITDAIELNLAWRDNDGAVERANLMRTNGSFTKVVDLGSRIAAVLDLPLLYHATARHWLDERKRSRRRRTGRGSIAT